MIMAKPLCSDRQGDNLIAFPRADLRHLLGAAMKRHRLPESLGQALVREAANFPEVSADAALAFALAQRLVPAPIDFEKARGILLVGPSGGRQERRCRQDFARRRPDRPQDGIRPRRWRAGAVPHRHQSAGTA